MRTLARFEVTAADDSKHLVALQSRPRGLYVRDEGSGSLEKKGQSLVLQDKKKALPLKPGGGSVWVGYVLMPDMSWGRGHYEATVAALAPFTSNDSGRRTLSSANVTSIAYASRLPDFEHFDLLAVHAQSTTEKDHRLSNYDQETGRTEKDLIAYQELLATHGQGFKDGLAFGDVRKVFYHLGYVMHMVQDLVVHQGMSNPEHCLHDWKGPSPDKIRVRYDLACLVARDTFELHFRQALDISHYRDDILASLEEDFSRILSRLSGTTTLRRAAEYAKDPLNKKYLGRPEYCSRWFRWNDERSEMQAARTKANEIIAKALSTKVSTTKASAFMPIEKKPPSTTLSSHKPSSTDFPMYRGKRMSRKLPVVAQDPSVRVGDRILVEEVEVPAESLLPGPRGCRLQVVDYDSSRDVLLAPSKTIQDYEVVAKWSSTELLENASFHGQNLYALVAKTLARFEKALGRRVSWGTNNSHHLYLVPHAFCDANAFYAPEENSLLFGYFKGRTGKPVFTCLSHDIVVHETTHALLDGIRRGYTEPSSADQAAFHEGLADVVALLSVFSMPRIVEMLIDKQAREETRRNKNRKRKQRIFRPGMVHQRFLEPSVLRESMLAGLAEEMGEEISAVRGSALRRSVELEPNAKYYQTDEEFKEPHRRGEILVAAMLNAFIEVWCSRTQEVGVIEDGYKSRRLVVEEGAEAADYLLTMAIRAIDYMPPIHATFPDYLRAMVTADTELRPNEGKYGFRRCLIKSFGDYGIGPSQEELDLNDGLWQGAPSYLDYEQIHFESIQTDPTEVYRFIWENRLALRVSSDAHGEVTSVRPCNRVAPDGFQLRETVAEFVQTLVTTAKELDSYGVICPKGLAPDAEVKLRGGGTLIFDEFGRLKFYVHNSLINPRRQTARVKHLWESGYFGHGLSKKHLFAARNRQRVTGSPKRQEQEW